MEVKFSDGQCEFSRVFNFTGFCYWRNSCKSDACEKLVFYNRTELCIIICSVVSQSEYKILTSGVDNQMEMKFSDGQSEFLRLFNLAIFDTGVIRLIYMHAKY